MYHIISYCRTKWHGQRSFAYSGPFDCLELTSTDSSWHVAITDSVLRATKIRYILWSTALPWQTRLLGIRREHKCSLHTCTHTYVQLRTYIHAYISYHNINHIILELYCVVLYCTVLYCTARHCTVLYCIVLYCIVLHCIALHCIVAYYFRPYYNVMLRNVM